jgi:hypothetical protein
LLISEKYGKAKVVEANCRYGVNVKAIAQKTYCDQVRLADGTQPVKRLPTRLPLIKENHLEKIDICLMPYPNA